MGRESKLNDKLWLLPQTRGASGKGASGLGSGGESGDSKSAHTSVGGQVFS